jgi:hypothetical protein
MSEQLSSIGKVRNNMNSNSKARIMHAAFFTPTHRGFGLPILYWGPPGTGKTAGAKTFAAGVAGLKDLLEILAPGERGEGAFGVIPVPGTDPATGQSVLNYPVADWALRMILAKFGLVFVDEYTTAPPAVQPALLSLVLEGKIGGATLPQRVRIFAAANAVSDAANGYDLAPPAANRHVHLNWEVSAAEIADYFIGGLIGHNNNNPAQIDAVQEETRVNEVWPAAFASAASKVACFLRAHPDLLHRMPQEGDPQRGRAWPSPRSWEMAARCLASGSVHGLTQEETDQLGAGCVGEHAWQEFSDYMASLDLPDPAMVLDGALQWAPDTKRLDITSAVINGALAVVLPTNAPRRIERINAMWQLLDRVGTMGARDLTHGPAGALAKAAPATILSGIGSKVLGEMRRTGFMDAVK